MYANPEHIRKHPVKVRLNDHELRLLELLAEANQTQLAVIARDLIMGGIKEDVLRVEQESSGCHQKLA